VLGFLAVVIMAIWPKQVQLVSRTLWRSPGACIGAGLIGLLISAAVIVVLVITICMSPLAALALSAAWLFGWCALGLLVGQRLLRALKVRDLAAIWQAALGVLIMSLVGALPCIGWAVWLFGGMYAFGSVILTRFGTRVYEAPSHPTTVPQATAVDPDAEAEDDVEMLLADAHEPADQVADEMAGEDDARLSSVDTSEDL
jgi:hypothetical protein